MARLARVIVPGFPYHVTHRGNHREDIFFSDSDRQSYLQLLDRYAKRFKLDVWAYCLMPNHVHLIVVGRERDSLASAIGNAHREHSRRINRERDWTGHLWANRFYSTALEDLHLWNAVRYVESNPVRAGLVGHALDHPWSSARPHACLCVDSLLAPERPFPGAVADWGNWLNVGHERPEYDALRRNTSTGRPTGSAAFVRHVETLTGRVLRRRRLRKARKTQT
jgi:putative transposase